MLKNRLFIVTLSKLHGEHWCTFKNHTVQSYGSCMLGISIFQRLSETFTVFPGNWQLFAMASMTSSWSTHDSPTLPNMDLPALILIYVYISKLPVTVIHQSRQCRHMSYCQVNWFCHRYKRSRVGGILDTVSALTWFVAHVLTFML